MFKAAARLDILAYLRVSIHIIIRLRLIRKGGIFMRQSNTERTQEIISMEEYLERRQEKRRTEFMKEPQKRRAAEWSAALELATLFV
ncbi:hypothetical protein [Clostridium sp. D5]|uniref:hypothetical protein n=1 Tax=Clostridium sp. D5 TaxID=556261 RepID=UPI0011DCC342|nr:hypothetical protein [Clostridium sp. D5]